MLMVTQAAMDDLCRRIEGAGLTPAQAAAIAAIPVPSNLIPIADDEADAAIRTGIAGTSLDYARADHNHPIRRQGNPGDPVLTLTVSGTAGATLGQVVILDRESDEESYAYKFRALINHVAGNGWDLLNIPTIAGFQQPEIYAIGTYRSQTLTPQIDNNTPGNLSAVLQGAAPVGPYMGKEAHEWSSTRRIYHGFYRREVAYSSYTEFWVRYTRL